MQRDDRELADWLRARTRFRRLVHVDCCSSTQQLAAHDRAADEAVFWADHQTGGRGRHGRSWDDEPARDLLVTFRLRLELTDPVRLPAMAPLCVLQAVEPLAGRELTLKWPNDVLADGRKLAGVLIDAGVPGPHGYLVGIGLNVNRTRLPRDLEASATSLALLTGREHDRARLLLALAEQVEAMAAALAAGDRGALAQSARRYADRLGLVGREVVLDAGSECTGVLAHIDFREARLADGRVFPLAQVRALRARRPPT